MNLSEHITMAEATRTYCKEANLPGEKELVNMTLLAHKVFEPLRMAVGFPINITSFYRSPAVNKAVGGSPTSQHVTGQAVDLNAEGKNKILFKVIRDTLQFDQLIWEFGTIDEPDWIHVSYKKTGNRGQVLRAKKANGKSLYLPM